MQAIDRMMLLITAVEGSQKEGATITELAAKTALPYATLHRLLGSLMSHKLLEQNKQKKYFLGEKWLEYGLSLYDQMDFISFIRADLDKLAYSIGESVYLHKLEEQDSMIIERIDSGLGRIQIIKPLGQRTPLHESAANLAMLAFLPATRVEQQFINSQQLAQIRYDRYCIQENEQEGILDIAMPLLSKPDVVIGAISVSVLRYNLSEVRIEQLKQALLATGQEMEGKLQKMVF